MAQFMIESPIQKLTAPRSKKRQFSNSLLTYYSPVLLIFSVGDFFSDFTELDIFTRGKSVPVFDPGRSS